MQPIATNKVDLSYLHAMSAGDAAFEKVLLASAVDDIDAQVANLQQAWQVRNAVATRQAAHSLKSVTAIAGSSLLEQACRKIDESFSDGCFHPEMGGSYLEIIVEWPDVKTLLQEIIAKY